MGGKDKWTKTTYRSHMCTQAASAYITCCLKCFRTLIVLILFKVRWVEVAFTTHSWSHHLGWQSRTATLFHTTFNTKLIISLCCCGLFIHISECVWLSDRYPVILSIENHCSVPQQKKMAQYLTEIFGDKLNLSSIKADTLGRLPSPEALKGRILVKVPPLSG